MQEQEPVDTSPRGARYALRVLTVRLRFIAFLLAILVVAASWNSVETRVARWIHGKAPAGASTDENFCPMHPAVVRTETGKCPSCGMPLSLRKKTDGAPPRAGRVQLSPLRIQQAGIRTSTVEWRPLELDIDAAGFVRYDETRIARVTARFAGRIESLEANATGTAIVKGKPLATIYSKDVTNALTTYLVSLREFREVESRSATAGIQRLRGQLDTARRQFALWGLEQDQLEEIEKAGQAPTTVAIRAPFSGVVTHREVVVGDYITEGTPLFHVADLSTVWLVANVTRDDLAFVALGQKLVATDTGIPGRTFEGSVTYVAPFLDEATQTAEVRAELPNPDGLLRPGTYVAAALRVPIATIEPFRSKARPAERPAHVLYVCPMHEEATRTEPGICKACGTMELLRKEVPAVTSANDVLAVPESAVIDTGPLQVVYVESEPGVFDAHTVELGPLCGDFYPVISGIEPGTRVATTGSFLIDAETRLNPGAAGTYFGASATPSGKSVPVPPEPVPTESGR